MPEQIKSLQKRQRRFFYYHRTMKIAFITLISILAFQNCFSWFKSTPPQEKKLFFIEPDFSKLKKAQAKLGFFKSRFRISPFFEGKGLTYKQTDINFETDFYNEFLIFPATNLTEVINKWIQDSELAEYTPFNLADEENTLLAGNINALYGDFRSEKSAKAVLELEMYIQKSKSDKLAFRKIYRKEISLTKPTPENLVIGWNQALTEILNQFTNDIRK